MYDQEKINSQKFKKNLSSKLFVEKPFNHACMSIDQKNTPLNLLQLKYDGQSEVRFEKFRFDLIGINSWIVENAFRLNEN